MPTTLITGAGRGLGLEFARRYHEDGWRVIATCRDPAAAGDLRSLGVETHAMDVTDAVAVAKVAKALKRDAIDLLINNAGIYGPRPTPLGSVDEDAWMEVLRVNTMAPLKISEAFADHVAASERRLIVSISSRLGSMADNTSGGAYIYRSSKAALNCVMRCLAADLKPRGIDVLMLHPGWVRTDMGGPTALVGVEQSVAGMRRVIAGLEPGDTGRFIQFDGEEIPW